MTEQTTGQLQKPSVDSSTPNDAASTSEATLTSTASTLTFSRGTRPLITRCAPYGNLYDYRRRA